MSNGFKTITPMHNNTAYRTAANCTLDSLRCLDMTHHRVEEVSIWPACEFVCHYHKTPSKHPMFPSCPLDSRQLMRKEDHE